MLVRLNLYSVAQGSLMKPRIKFLLPMLLVIKSIMRKKLLARVVIIMMLVHTAVSMRGTIKSKKTAQSCPIGRCRPKLIGYVNVNKQGSCQMLIIPWKAWKPDYQASVRGYISANPLPLRLTSGSLRRCKKSECLELKSRNLQNMSR